MSDTQKASPQTSRRTPAEEVVKYRTKKKLHETVTKEVLKDEMKPGGIMKMDSPVSVKPGPKPHILKDFNENPQRFDFAIYMQQGLTVEEAGILAGFSTEQMKTLNDRSESYRRFVDLQMIKFKQKHLKVISDKDNPSTSQWLLEQKFPEQYGKKAKADIGAGSTQVIQAIIKSVQMSPDKTVIHEHENTEEKIKEHNEPRLDKGNQPTLEPGGASILQ